MNKTLQRKETNMARTTLKNDFSSKIFDLVDENKKLIVENENIRMILKAAINGNYKILAENKHLTIDNEKQEEKIKWQNQRIDDLIADNAALMSTINQQGVQIEQEVKPIATERQIRTIAFVAAINSIKNTFEEIVYEEIKKIEISDAHYNNDDIWHLENNDIQIIIEALKKFAELNK